MLEWLVDWLISRGQKPRIYTDLTLISISVCISICTDMNRSPWFWYRLCISLYETPTAYELANGPETADGAETHDAGTHATILDEYSVASGKGWQRHIRRYRGSLYICRVFLLLSSHYILVNTRLSPSYLNNPMASRWSSWDISSRCCRSLALSGISHLLKFRNS
jgi:hypothetical protein